MKLYNVNVRQQSLNYIRVTYSVTYIKYEKLAFYLKRNMENSGDKYTSRALDSDRSLWRPDLGTLWQAKPSAARRINYGARHEAHR